MAWHAGVDGGAVCKIRMGADLYGGAGTRRKPRGALVRCRAMVWTKSELDLMDKLAKRPRVESVKEDAVGVVPPGAEEPPAADVCVARVDRLLDLPMPALLPADTVEEGRRKAAPPPHDAQKLGSHNWAKAGEREGATFGLGGAAWSLPRSSMSPTSPMSPMSPVSHMASQGFEQHAPVRAPAPVTGLATTMFGLRL